MPKCEDMTERIGIHMGRHAKPDQGLDPSYKGEHISVHDTRILTIQMKRRSEETKWLRFTMDKVEFMLHRLEHVHQ